MVEFPYPRYVRSCIRKNYICLLFKEVFDLSVDGFLGDVPMQEPYICGAEPRRLKIHSHN